MKKKIVSTLMALTVCITCHFVAASQITAAKMAQYLSDNKFPNNISTSDAANIGSFYEALRFNTAWINENNKADLLILLNTLKNAPLLGLREKDYQNDAVLAVSVNTKSIASLSDSIDTEILLTDAAIHFYTDMLYGNTKPSLGFNGIDEVMECQQIPERLAEYIGKHQLAQLSQQLSPSLPEIAAIQQKISWLHTIMADTAFKDVVITSNKVSTLNRALVTKLFQLGITNDTGMAVKDSMLIGKVKEAQKQFALLADGTLRKTILAELNVPLHKRLRALNLAINYYRWLSCFCRHRATIVVNIPAAYLKVYKDNAVTLEMRMIVGKKTTPTPTLLSTVNEVILYPYWHVPYSIATKELLPHIKRNTSFIDQGNYQVLNSAGNIVDPYSINWRLLGPRNFPYIIRQSTGCDNALGLLKLNFYNPYGVYLHDTPNKDLFALNKRYFSHGCMRMEKPMELGHLVVKNNMIAIDTLTQKGCLKNQSPITVHADVHMPVLVWYNPVGIDNTGRLLFFEDVYSKFE